MLNSESFSRGGGSASGARWQSQARQAAGAGPWVAPGGADSERRVIPVGRTHGAERYPSVVALLGEGL